MDLAETSVRSRATILGRLQTSSKVCLGRLPSADRSTCLNWDRDISYKLVGSPSLLWISSHLQALVRLSVNCNSVI
jgi:hypothetical protein